jgi:hypothetical protein
MQLFKRRSLANIKKLKRQQTKVKGDYSREDLSQAAKINYLSTSSQPANPHKNFLSLKCLIPLKTIVK